MPAVSLAPRACASDRFLTCVLARQLEGCSAQYGVDHQETRTSASNLHGLLVEMGMADEAAAIAKTYLPDMA